MVRIWRKKEDKDMEDEKTEKRWEPEEYRRGYGRYYPRRYYDPFWDDDFFFGRSIFREIEEEMERMHREMDALMERALRGELPPPEKGGPIVYGFSMQIGPDGKPKIQEFGNTKLARGLWRLPFRGSEGDELPETSVMAREPITDVIETGDEVWITAEVPGVRKEDIDIELGEDSLTIRVDTPERKYYKEVTLPCKVKTTGTKATYKNGVLDIKLKKLEAKKGSKKIKVE